MYHRALWLIVVLMQIKVNAAVKKSKLYQSFPTKAKMKVCGIVYSSNFYCCNFTGQ